MKLTKKWFGLFVLFHCLVNSPSVKAYTPDDIYGWFSGAYAEYAAYGNILFSTLNDYGVGDYYPTEGDVYEPYVAYYSNQTVVDIANFDYQTAKDDALNACSYAQLNQQFGEDNPSTQLITDYACTAYFNLVNNL
jgi:hypothetical protein